MSDAHESYAFEPFSSLDGVLRGEPIKIMPVGTFYRDSRKLTITPERLLEFAANVKAGLPRFRIPINENHGGVGKVGTVSDINYLAAGPDGDGLYATAYELTDAGRELVTSKRFDAVSPEAVWTLNDGAKYQDPTTGTQHDNVLVGLALTDRPFFGHDQVALFSAYPPADNSDWYRDFTSDKRQELAKSGAALPDGSFPIENTSDLENAIHAIGRASDPARAKAHIKKRAAALGATDKLPDDWADPHKGAETMTIETVIPVVPPAPVVVPAPDKFSVSADEFAALKAKAGEVDKMSAMLGEMRRARRVDQLIARAKETFAYIPVKAEDLAEKFAALEERDAELFKFFDGLMATLDRQVATGNLFGQIASGMTSSNAPDSFDALIEKVLTDKFAGDRSKYAEAMSVARKQRPDLFAEYSDTYSVPERRKS